MSPDQIRAIVSRLHTDRAEAEEAAWAELRSLGPEVVPYLLEAYPGFRKWRGRVSLVYHATSYARISDEAYRLGLLAVNDKATLVRHRACALLAYSLRTDAIQHLKPLLSHLDAKTADDAAAAIDALKNQNHHYFQDRDHSGSVFWVVDEDDHGAIA